MTRMDAGGYAACFDHQQLALMCANSDRTIDRLGAENKQLKAENAKLRAENAKLRELCEDIYKRFRGVVFECWAYSSEDFRMYEQRMRELGIEVPDGEV